MVNLIPNSPNTDQEKSKTVLNGQPKGFDFAERLYNQARGRDPDADVNYKGPDLAKEVYEDTGGYQSPSETNNGAVDKVRENLPKLNVNDVFQSMPDEQQLSDAVVERHPFFNKDESGNISPNVPGLDMPGLPGFGSVEIPEFDPLKNFQFPEFPNPLQEINEFMDQIMRITKLSVVGLIIVFGLREVLNSEYFS